MPTKWRQECIWIEAVEKEKKAIQNWNDKWAFLADYDSKVCQFLYLFVNTKFVFTNIKINTKCNS